MNYMEQVAKMLGVEIGEEFRVVNDRCLYKLDDKGLYFLATDDKWKIDYFTLTSILNGKAMIIKKPILDDIEKEYLSGIIKPFRNRVKYITKFRGVFDNEFIEIGHVMDNEAELYYIELPLFKKGTMYQGMELGRNYTLEELGL